MTPALTPPRSSPSLLLTALLVLAALGLGSALHKRLPTPEEIRQRPFVVNGMAGEWLALRSGDVRLAQVDATTQLNWEGRQAKALRGGTFLVLKLDYRARKQPGSLSSIAVQSPDERFFGERPPLGASTCIGAQPGIPVQCDITVEIARDALAGAKLRVSEDFYSGGEGDSVAVIDLGLDAAKARALGERTRPLTVRPLARIEER